MRSAVSCARLAMCDASPGLPQMRKAVRWGKRCATCARSTSFMLTSDRPPSCSRPWNGGSVCVHCSVKWRPSAPSATRSAGDSTPRSASRLKPSFKTRLVTPSGCRIKRLKPLPLKSSACTVDDCQCSSLMKGFPWINSIKACVPLLVSIAIRQGSCSSSDMSPSVCKTVSSIFVASCRKTWPPSVTSRSSDAALNCWRRSGSMRSQLRWRSTLSPTFQPLR
ncbi:hypothetical protein VM94_02485 [Janthinobacterium sp. KBS0711]|nr:hypothetical protein VM94_02485 [Janthinobacterium sp. KBS0711]